MLVDANLRVPGLPGDKREHPSLNPCPETTSCNVGSPGIPVSRSLGVPSVARLANPGQGCSAPESRDTPRDCPGSECAKGSDLGEAVPSSEPAGVLVSSPTLPVVKKKCQPTLARPEGGSWGTVHAWGGGRVSCGPVHLRCCGQALLLLQKVRRSYPALLLSGSHSILRTRFPRWLE